MTRWLAVAALLAWLIPAAGNPMLNGVPLPRVQVDRPQEPQPRGRPCTAEEFRQFDFWLGNWVIKSADGRVAGQNAVGAILGGCAIRQSWRGPQGKRGDSTSVYDAGARRWYQTWVDENGGLLRLEGGWNGNSMVLSGERFTATGHVTDRMTWTPAAGGRLRQLWEMLPDGGTWTTVFDVNSERAPN